MNSVQLIGRLTHDPDAARTTSGTPVTAFRLAIDRPGRNAADFLTVKTWERLAETTAEHLTRGRRVAVEGRLAQEEWVGSDGRRAERLTVVADRVEFLDAPAGRVEVVPGEVEASSDVAAVPRRRSESPSQPSPGGPPRAA